MIVPVMAISNLVLTQQIYSEETNGPHAHYREPVPLITHVASGPILIYICALLFPQVIQVDVAQTRNHRNPSKYQDIQGLW